MYRISNFAAGWNIQRKLWPLKAVILLALAYALLAGLRTVGDADLGWQLATGRWIVQHRQIPSTDVLSYTARGTEWIYPPLSQVILYCLYVVGGYPLLSWLGALISIASILLLVPENTVTAILGLLAVPVIASRTGPRADMFTIVLFAVYLSLLWRYHKTGRGPLWLLPSLMVLWVNLHLGFVAGLGMCAAYVLLEAGEMVGRNRAAPVVRLRAAAPWLAATALATVLNPWGPRIYVALVRQNRILHIHESWISEWMSVRLNSECLREALAWRNPDSALWWLLVASVVAIAVAAANKRFAAALLLAASSYLALHVIRYQALFASIAVVIGGSIIGDWCGTRVAGFSELREEVSAPKRKGLAIGAGVALVAVLTALTGVRAWDLVTDRSYLANTTGLSVFGTGISRWYPEQAAEFVEREHLPGNIFNDYNEGGFLAWRLSSYPDYIDGRAVPFGPARFFRANDLLARSPDSPSWKQEADAHQINTIILSLVRDIGGGLVHLNDFCQSESWRPVFLDDRSVVLVRVRPETMGIISRFQVSCQNFPFDNPPAGKGLRALAERFDYFLNSASILIALGRNSDAAQILERAGFIFPESGTLHYLKGLALLNSNQWRAAERELRTAIEISPTEKGWRTLSLLYEYEQRLPEALRALNRAAELAQQPYREYIKIASLQLDLQLPQQALMSYEQATHWDPYPSDTEQGTELRAQIAEGRATAWWSLGDFPRAIRFQQDAVRLTPENTERQLRLAQLYESLGIRQTETRP